MDSVSGRVTAFNLATLRKRGIDIDALLSGTSLSVDVLEDATAAVPWDDFLVFLERIDAHGGPGLLGDLGSGIVDFAGNRPLRALARIAWTEKQFWHLLAKRLAPPLYPFADFTFEHRDDGRFQLTVEIPATHRGSELFMHYILGVVRAIPRFLGAEHDAEVEARISPRVGVAIIEPSLAAGFVARGLRAAAALVVGNAAFEELERRHRTAEETTARLEARNRTIAAFDAVAGAITHSVDFAGTANRIADAVVAHSEFSGVALYTMSEDGTQFELAASRPAEDLAMPARVPLGQWIGTRALTEQRVLWFRDSEGFGNLHPSVADAVRDTGLERFAIVPLIFHGEVMGTLGVSSPIRRSFDAQEEASLLALGKTAAAALMSARHVSRIEREVEDRRQAEENLRTIAENVAGVFYLLDAETRALLYLSPSFEHVTGYAAEPLVRDPRRFGDLVHPEDRARFQEARNQALGLRDFEVEYRMLHADGSTRNFLDRVRILRGADGTPGRLVGFAQDVTETRALEQQLRHSQKMDAVGRLAGSIAHDFNNLLTVILADSQLLKSRFPEGSSDHEVAAEILGATNRAAVLTRRLLTLARKQPTRLETLDLRIITTELAPMLRSLVGGGANIELALDAAADLFVRGDRGQIEQVLVNLVVNARDAMPERGTITVGCQPVGNETIELFVADTGTGMDVETQAHVFEPFFSTKAPDRSTGLGLAIVQGIVEQTGARIRLESALGEGTRLSIEFPRVGAPPVAEPPVQPRRTRGHETVLVVEDRDNVRAVVVRTLEERGYKVLAAANPEEALKLADANEIALLLTDIVMPEMTGVELSQRLGKTRPGLPVLFVSGYTGDGDRAMPDVPAEAVLAKPFSPDALALAVRERIDAGAIT